MHASKSFNLICTGDRLFIAVTCSFIFFFFSRCFMRLPSYSLSRIPNHLYSSVLPTSPSFASSLISSSFSLPVLITMYLVFFRPYINFFLFSISAKFLMAFLISSAVPADIASSTKNQNTNDLFSNTPFLIFSDLIHLICFYTAQVRSQHSSLFHNVFHLQFFCFSMWCV